MLTEPKRGRTITHTMALEFDCNAVDEALKLYVRKLYPEFKSYELEVAFQNDGGCTITGKRIVVSGRDE